MVTAPTIGMGDLPDFLLHTAVVAPVFVWGPPGVGKSAVVEQFAGQVGMPCVSLLGSQLAPEDLIGVPRIEDGFSVFCPPRMIARSEPYVLFLDELNACGPDVQKAFYSMIHERRLGEYHLPEGSVIIGAGNRSADNAIVRQMSSALINRMVHVAVRADHDAWMAWAVSAGIEPTIYEYVREHPRHLWSKPPKEERCFSTPRSWHLLSNMIKERGADRLTPAMAHTLAASVLTPEHAQIFATWWKNKDQRYVLNHILKGDRGWPEAPDERDLLHYLALSFRDQLIKELPIEPAALNNGSSKLRSRGLELLRSLADLAPELAQMVLVADEEGRSLPDWFMIEIGDALPALTARHKTQKRA
jgi:hypothetical protein